MFISWPGRIFAVLLWSTVLLWVHFMLLRMLRWKYLEMKYAPEWTPTAGRPSKAPTPPASW